MSTSENDDQLREEQNTYDINKAKVGSNRGSLLN